MGIPDRALGFNGWRLGACNSNEVDLGDENTDRHLLEVVHKRGCFGIESLKKSIDLNAMKAVISENVIHGHRDSCVIEPAMGNTRTYQRSFEGSQSCNHPYSQIPAIAGFDGEFRLSGACTASAWGLGTPVPDKARKRTHE